MFPCLDLSKDVAKRADFRRQALEIRQHVFRRQIDFRQHGLSHRCGDVFGKMVDARNREENNNRGDDHQDRRRIDQRQQQLPGEPPNRAEIPLPSGSAMVASCRLWCRVRKSSGRGWWPRPRRRDACAEGYTYVGSPVPLPAWTSVNASAR